MGTHLLRRTLVALVDARVRFVVCGGVACILQGVARVPEPVRALLDPERRRSWVVEKHAVVYTLVAADGAFSLDIFLQYPLSFEELAAEADPFAIDGRRVLVSSKRNLILAKLQVTPPRKVDRRDIEDLLELLDAAG